ncbi:MAG: oxidoreductase [Pseudomonadota bacterium]|jgi:hypothetical protein
MNRHADFDEVLYAGLQALAASAFPKRCGNCGRVFATPREFLEETRRVSSGASGLKQSVDDDGRPVVELYRNCPCGSTLLDFFNDRRDVSEAGLERRRRFGELLDYLTAQGVERGLARRELLRVLRGEPSELLRRLRAPGAAGGPKEGGSG